MPANDNIRLHEIQADVYIARRKRFHAVYDPSAAMVFTSPHICDVFQWLADKDIHTVILTDNENTFTMTFVSRPLHMKPA